MFLLHSGQLVSTVSPWCCPEPRYHSVLVLVSQVLSSQGQVLLIHMSLSRFQKTYFHLPLLCGPKSRAPKFYQQQNLTSHIAHVSWEWQCSFINENPVLGTVKPCVADPPFPPSSQGLGKRGGFPLHLSVISSPGTAALEMMPGSLREAQVRAQTGAVQRILLRR